MSITISRPQYGDGRQKISITVVDNASRIEFLDLEIDLDEMMAALTGGSRRPCEAEIRGLESVGKTRVTEKREIVCPLKSYRRGELEKWLQENAQEDGWILDLYLGSHASTASHPDGTLLRYNVTKFVDTESLTTRAR